MSANLSDRAQGRVRELRERVLERLRTHDPLVSRMATLDGTEYGGEPYGDGPYSGFDPSTHIVPRLTMRRWRDDNSAPDPPGAALAVGTISTSSDRRNHKEDARFAVQVEFDVHPSAIRAMGPAWVDAVMDECSAVLTSHDPSWNAQGESGGTLEPRWDESHGRYIAMRRYTIVSFI